MINYIIIENEKKYQKQYKEIINDLMSNNNKYQIHIFSKLNNGLNQLINNNQIFKIYLIDIHLDCKYTGIDIAKQIRNQDLDSEIIFISGQDIMFEPVFKTIPKVYSFIYKYSHLEEKLYQDLNTIINNYYSKNIYINLDKKGNTKILLNEILYIYRETQERKVYIVTKEGKYPICLSIKDIAKKYKDILIQVHRACLVNPNQICLYNYQEGYFILKNNTKVFMCSKRFKHKLSKI